MLCCTVLYVPTIKLLLMADYVWYSMVFCSVVWRFKVLWCCVTFSDRQYGCNSDAVYSWFSSDWTFFYCCRRLVIPNSRQMSNSHYSYTLIAHFHALHHINTTLHTTHLFVLIPQLSKLYCFHFSSLSLT